MMEQDATRLCGERYAHKDGCHGHRWGRAEGKVGFHGGKVSVDRPRVRARGSQEMELPSWETAQAEDWLGSGGWALNLMLINVSTSGFGSAVRLPEGDIPASDSSGISKSAVSRRLVALSAVRMNEWMTADLSKLDLIVIQIDGIQIETDLVLLAAVGIDGDGVKHAWCSGGSKRERRGERRYWIIWSSGVSTRKSAVYSSLTVRRRCGRRSARRSASTLRSSVARSTRAVTFWSVFPSICMPRSARPAASLGAG